MDISQSSSISITSVERRGATLRPLPLAVVLPPLALEAVLLLPLGSNGSPSSSLSSTSPPVLARVSLFRLVPVRDSAALGFTGASSSESMISIAPSDTGAVLERDVLESGGGMEAFVLP